MRTTGSATAATGPRWAAVARDRAVQPARYADFDEKRRQFMTHVQNGHVKEAQPLGSRSAKLRTGQGAGDRRIEPQRHRPGVGQPAARSGGRVPTSVASGRRRPAYEAVNLMLLLSDAQRRAGDSAAAERTWLSAAELAAESGSRSRADHRSHSPGTCRLPAAGQLVVAAIGPAAVERFERAARHCFSCPTPQISTAPRANFTRRGPLVDRHRPRSTGPKRVASGTGGLETGRIDDQQPAGRRTIADCGNAGSRPAGPVGGRHRPC